MSQCNLEQTIPSTKKRKINYHNWGRISAIGPAMIVDLGQDFEEIPWTNLRFFLRPFNSTFGFHSIRVKPSMTTFYGPEKRVFALPPAPAQWLDRLALRRIPECQVEVFAENLGDTRMKRYGIVTYVFPDINHQVVPIPGQVNNENTNNVLQLTYLICYLFLVKFTAANRQTLEKLQ